MKKLIITSTIIILASCTTHVPVTGNIDGAEKFTGVATRTHPSNSGTLTITSNLGTTCTGDFSYFKGSFSGSGTFDCSDNRAGRFKFDISGNKGHGIGNTFQGEPIEFFFNESIK